MKKKIECFEDLFIWQKAVEFAKDIYLLTERLEDGLRFKKSNAGCVGFNFEHIAEGFERRSRKEYLNFLNIAKGSAGEIRSQLYVAFSIGYINQTELSTMREKAKFLSGSIQNHSKAISDS